MSETIFPNTEHVSPHLTWAELGCHDGTPYPTEEWRERGGARMIASLLKSLAAPVVKRFRRRPRVWIFVSARRGRWSVADSKEAALTHAEKLDLLLRAAAKVVSRWKKEAAPCPNKLKALMVEHLTNPSGDAEDMLRQILQGYVCERDNARKLEQENAKLTRQKDELWLCMEEPQKVAARHIAEENTLREQVAKALIANACREDAERECNDLRAHVLELSTKNATLKRRDAAERRWGRPRRYSSEDDMSETIFPNTEHVSPHLTWAELGCHDGTPYPTEEWRERAVILAGEFEEVRTIAGGRPIRVTSAYRTDHWNRTMPGGPGAEETQHKDGRALDLAGEDENHAAALEAAVQIRLEQSGCLIRGWAVYASGIVHIDTRPIDPPVAHWKTFKPAEAPA